MPVSAGRQVLHRGYAGAVAPIDIERAANEIDDITPDSSLGSSIAERIERRLEKAREILAELTDDR